MFFDFLIPLLHQKISDISILVYVVNGSIFIPLFIRLYVNTFSLLFFLLMIFPLYINDTTFILMMSPFYLFRSNLYSNRFCNSFNKVPRFYTILGTFYYFVNSFTWRLYWWLWSFKLYFKLFIHSTTNL